jgi:hypothetical protein
MFSQIYLLFFLFLSRQLINIVFLVDSRNPNDCKIEKEKYERGNWKVNKEREREIEEVEEVEEEEETHL